MIGSRTARFGARLIPSGGVRFRFFAPAAQRASVVIADRGERVLPLDARGGGWFETHDPTARAGTRYAFAVDGSAVHVPDPASRFQPDGVHGMSEVIDPASFAWPDDGWRGRPWHEHVLYELHVGAFTPGGTYASATERLDDLVELGITAVELMPLAETPGERNWGYDGVLLYAPAHRYGRPDDLKGFIAAAHRRGLAVLLDVVYNHFGPEGNYLHGYAPSFFTDRYATPWGAAVDFSHDDVRAFVIENALYWIEEYRFDGLRLDATQTIFDERKPSVLEELHDTVEANRPPDRHVALVVENDHNEIGLLRAGFEAQWNDDFHHAVHVLCTGENRGYYREYAARPAWYLGRTLTEGFGYQGEPSRHRGGMPRGASSRDLPLTAFVNFVQNHDQIGNRARGERLAMLAPLDAVRAAAAVLLLAPSPPLLFMGEEWAASSPFLFFCDFEPALAPLVTAGRRREFASFPEFAEPEAQAAIPDPGAAETFARSVLAWEERDAEPHRAMREHYRALLRLRQAEIVPRNADVDGRGAHAIALGASGLRATWTLADGTTLTLDANLGAAPLSGFARRLPGHVLYASHGETYEGGSAPPWAVRWALA